MDEMLWADIRRLFFHEKLRRRAIARKLGLHRDTVERALASDTCPKRAWSERGSLVDEYEEAIRGILSNYPKLSGVRIFEKIRELGYSGKLTILRDRVRMLRPRHREAFLKRESLPGEEAQADWGSCGSIRTDGVARPLSVFVMALSFSRMLYVEFTVSQEMEDFLRCHLNAFRYFGGVPKKIVYDNLRSVVRWRQGRLMRLNTRFAEFAGHFPFEPVACNPARGNEKPRAETGVRYVKQNFLAGRELLELHSIRLAAFHWLGEVANVRFHRTTGERPCDRFERERSLLGPLPPVLPDTRIVRSVYVTHQARVAFQANTYSVPPELIGRTLTLKAAPERLWLYENDREVATHVRFYGRNRDIEDKAHTRAILALKRRGHLDKERDEFLALGPLATRFLDGLVRRGHATPAIHIQKLLMMLEEYGVTRLKGALERAVECGAFGADYVANILVQQTSPEEAPRRKAPLALPSRPELSELAVEEPDLTDYQHLTPGEEIDEDENQ